MSTIKEEAGRKIPRWIGYLSGQRRPTGSQQPASHQALKQAIPTIVFKKGEIYDNQ
jgi:hypothetical protein